MNDDTLRQALKIAQVSLERSAAEIGARLATRPLAHEDLSDLAGLMAELSTMAHAAATSLRQTAAERRAQVERGGDA